MKKKKETPWLSPELLNLPQGLLLFAKTVLHRLEGGMHRSRSSGEEQEFSQYRAYQPGDDLRLLDWKLYARSKRLYVRQAEVPRQLQVLTMVDCSASMLHSSGPWSKFDYARALAAALGMLVQRQNDVPGLQLIHERQPKQLLFSKGRHQMQEYLHLLQHARASGSWPGSMPAALQQQARSAGLVVLLTDLYEEVEELKKSLGTLIGTGQDLWVLHLLTPEEENPALFKKGAVLEDLETGEKMQLRSGSDQKASAEAFSAWKESWKQWLQKRGIAYLPVNIQEEPLAILRLYLNSKSKAEQW